MALGRGPAWTDERVAVLKKLFADGLSGSVIADQLGVTRNAVIGKVHRLGLWRRDMPAPQARRAHRARTQRPRWLKKLATPKAPPPEQSAPVAPLPIGSGAVHGNIALAHAYKIEVEPEPELIDNVIPISQRCSIMELTESTCRWPVGDPGSRNFFFCGGNTISPLPYCAYHARIAYQPSADRRRDRRSNA